MFGQLKNIFSKSKSQIGIDLGSSAIKLVEINPDKGRFKLETYGFAYFESVSSFVNVPRKGAAQSFFLEKSETRHEELFQFTPDAGFVPEIVSSREIGQIIKELLKDAKVKSKNAYFSIPSFKTFSTIIELPEMPEEEIKAAIPYEAKKYIPVPLEDVILDWSIIGRKQGVLAGEPAVGQQPNSERSEPVLIKKDYSESETEKISEDGEMAEALASVGQTAKGETEKIPEAPAIQLLVVAIFKEIIEKYTDIARAAGLEIKALEPESFSLARSLVGGESGLFAIVDIGSSFINITLVENGTVKIIHNTEKNISRATGQLQNESVVQALQKVINLYRNKFGIEDFSQKPICILTGGSVLALNLAGAIQRQFGGEVYIGDPFSRTNYPEILDATLKEIGPPLSVAVGLAMR